MPGRNQSNVCVDSELESIFTRVFAEGSPRAIGRGEMVGVIFQNPLENADGNANANEVLIGSATNMIWLLLPGQESPLIYAEDQKDVYVKRNSASIADGAILAITLENGGFNYTPGDILVLSGGDGNAQITVDTVDANGTILTFTLTTAGANYTTGIETAGGGTGVGAININVLGAGGAGYAPGDMFTVDRLFIGGTLATGVVDTVDGGGAVLTYHLTNRGNHYSSGNGTTTTATSGVGAGLTLDITAISASFDITAVQEGNDVTCLIYRKRKGGKQ